MEIPSQLPLAPKAMLIPVAVDQAYTLITFGVLAIVGVLMLRHARSSGSMLPILALLGGAVSVLLEPIFDVVVCLWYPVGGHTLFRAFDISVPAWVMSGYALYMGAGGYWMFLQFRAGLTPARLWKYLLLFIIADVVLEAPGIYLGLYIYYGDQPFPLLGFPLWMAVVNSMVPVFVGAAFYGLRDVLIGGRAWLAIPLVPMVVASGEIALGWPIWFALNSHVGLAATQFAAAIAIGLTFASAYCVGAVISKTSGKAERRLHAGDASPVIAHSHSVL